MKKIYGSFIFFFYFIKYPVVIYLLVNYFYLGITNSLYIYFLGVISVILILKDFIFGGQMVGKISSINIILL